MAIYLGKKKHLGGGQGNVSHALKADNATNSVTANSASTATNATKLNNVAYSDILERNYTYSKAVNQGWFRIAQGVGTASTLGKGGIIILERSFTYNYSEVYIFAITKAYGGSYSITQLAGNWSDIDAISHIITKIRVGYNDGSGAFYVDMYNSIAGGRQFSVTCIGGLDAVNFEAVTTAPSTVFEFATAKGFKSQTN